MAKLYQNTDDGIQIINAGAGWNVDLPAEFYDIWLPALGTVPTALLGILRRLGMGNMWSRGGGGMIHGFTMMDIAHHMRIGTTTLIRHRERLELAKFIHCTIPHQKEREQGQRTVIKLLPMPTELTNELLYELMDGRPDLYQPLAPWLIDDYAKRMEITDWSAVAREVARMQANRKALEMPAPAPKNILIPDRNSIASDPEQDQIVIPDGNLTTDLESLLDPVKDHPQVPQAESADGDGDEATGPEYVDLGDDEKIAGQHQAGYVVGEGESIGKKNTMTRAEFAACCNIQAFPSIPTQGNTFPIFKTRCYPGFPSRSLSKNERPAPNTK